MHQGEPRFDVDLTPTIDDMTVARSGLQAYSRTQKPASDLLNVAVYVREPDGRIVGGVLAETRHGWLHISQLWVSEAVRGRRFGRRLLAAAEEEGRRRGCHSAFLDTFNSQALPFYERCGNVVFGTLENFPVGHARYFLKRILVDR